MDPILIVALVFALLAAGFLAAMVAAVRRRSVVGSVTGLLATLLMLVLAALCAAISVGTQGYRALAKEEVAARVEVVPTGEQAFRAVVHLPDSTAATYRLEGDQVYVDARILKWKPLANVLGLHTEYELDRVAGRYVDVEDAKANPRSVYRLGRDRPVDVFDLRKRLPAVLGPLVDAEYGSATFVSADDTVTLEVRVSTTGLLMRRADTARGKPR